MLDACRAFGEYRGENPARWKGHLDHLLPKISSVHTAKNFSAMPYIQLPGFMRDLRSRDGIVAVCLEFQIATASRPGNAVCARWDEVDREAAVWTIAAENMKGKRAHTVPLNAAALEVLDRMDKIRSGPFIFPSRNGRPLSDAAVGALLGRTGHSDIVAHGFRSSFRDWCAEQTNFPSELAEMSLAHTVGNAVERSYRRGDLLERRRQLMTAWGAFCDADPAKTGDNIVELRAAQ